MVEGDLVDLTLPSLLQAMSRECSTATLRLLTLIDPLTPETSLWLPR